VVIFEIGFEALKDPLSLDLSGFGGWVSLLAIWTHVTMSRKI
jgi:hypothetical protein